LKCRLCDTEATQDTYCRPHSRAYKNIVRKYEAWKKAVGISWKEYLSEIAENSLTGEWVKEVAEYMVKNGDEQDVT